MAARNAVGNIISFTIKILKKNKTMDGIILRRFESVRSIISCDFFVHSGVVNRLEVLSNQI